jgi:hypothetical protein
MTSPRVDTTINELLADPLTRAVMQADRVDPGAFEAMLRSLARHLESQTQAGAGPESGGVSPREGGIASLRRAGFDCLTAWGVPRPGRDTILAKMRPQGRGATCPW